MTGADIQLGGKQGAILSLPGFCINRRIGATRSGKKVEIVIILIIGALMNLF